MEEKQFDRLEDVISRFFWPLKNFVEFLEGQEQEELLTSQLAVLVDAAKHNFGILDAVLREAFGDVRLEINESMPTYGLFTQRNFGKVVTEPGRATAQEGVS
jgi:hypothetical protein